MVQEATDPAGAQLLLNRNAKAGHQLLSVFQAAMPDGTIRYSILFVKQQRPSPIAIPELRYKGPQ